MLFTKISKHKTFLSEVFLGMHLSCMILLNIQQMFPELLYVGHWESQSEEETEAPSSQFAFRQEGGTIDNQ